MAPSGKRANELPTGILKTACGYRTVVWLPHPDRPKGWVASKRWKAEATLTEMRQWREDRRVEARKPTPIAEEEPELFGFIADAATYLDSVRAMPSFKDRARDIGEWIAIFGERPSLEITSQPIRAARDRWMTIGPKRVLETRKEQKPHWVSKAIPLSPSAVNHRLRALENFFTVMYPHEENPVREVPEAIEPDAEPRGHSFALALEILAQMPDITTPKKGQAAEKGSLSRARFEAMLWTGLPAVQISRLTPEMVNWQAGTLTVPRRKKGRTSRRSRSRVSVKPRPLLPQAQDALKRFFALNGQRKFSSTSLSRSVHRAIAAANRIRADKQLPLMPPRLRVYDLTRHTFGTEAMRASGNLKAVQELLGHADITQTERYAAAAVAEQTVLAIDQLAQAIKRKKRTAGRTAGWQGADKVSPLISSGRDRTRRTSIRKNA